MKQPRYIVREITGFTITPSGERSSRQATEVMVLDRGYCHKVVWSSEASPVLCKTQKYGRGTQGQRIKKGWKKYLSSCRQWSVARRRAYAVELCKRLNAEDQAWLTK